jgi:hypothetical protein
MSVLCTIVWEGKRHGSWVDVKEKARDSPTFECMKYSKTTQADTPFLSSILLYSTQKPLTPTELPPPCSEKQLYSLILGHRGADCFAEGRDTHRLSNPRLVYGVKWIFGGVFCIEGV